MQGGGGITTAGTIHAQNNSINPNYHAHKATLVPSPLAAH